jgi:hypothetical protein
LIIGAVLAYGYTAPFFRYLGGLISRLFARLH